MLLPWIKISSFEHLTGIILLHCWLSHHIVKKNVTHILKSLSWSDGFFPLILLLLSGSWGEGGGRCSRNGHNIHGLNTLSDQVWSGCYTLLPSCYITGLIVRQGRFGQGENILTFMTTFITCLFFFRGLFIIDDEGTLRQITMNDLPVCCNCTCMTVIVPWISTASFM